jgi:hypothetical protein
MIRHPTISVLFMSKNADASLASLLAYLRSMPHIRLSVQPHLPQDLNSYDVVISLNERGGRISING